MNWFATFLNLYAAGTALGMAAVPPRAIGRYFFTLNSLIVLLLAVVATLVGKPLWGARPAGAGPLIAHVAAAAFAVSAVVLAGAIRAGRGDVPRGVLLLPVVAGAVFATCAAFAASPAFLQGVLLWAHLVTSAAVLGSSLMAMILGHWYLANAALSFDHLVRLSRLFLGAALAKSAVSAITIAMDSARLWEILTTRFDGILIGVRGVAGLAGSVVLAAMALSCAKMRANQSATGILYVAVLFALIGELISIYLTLERGLIL